MKLFVVTLGVLASCSKPDAKLVKKLSLAADMFDDSIDRLEKATAAGEPCYPIVDGYIHYKVQDFGHVVAKEARELQDRFNFCVVVFDAYKTSLAERFDALAKRIDAWVDGPYARAIDACKQCVENAPGLGEGCSVP